MIDDRERFVLAQHEIRRAEEKPRQKQNQNIDESFMEMASAVVKRGYLVTPNAEKGKTAVKLGGANVIAIRAALPVEIDETATN